MNDGSSVFRFIILAERAQRDIACGHKRCIRQRFEELWYDYMYGLNGKARFAEDIDPSVPHFYG